MRKRKTQSKHAHASTVQQRELELKILCSRLDFSNKLYFIKGFRSRTNSLISKSHINILTD